MSMKFITLTSLKRTQNLIQIDLNLCEIIGAEELAFLHCCDFEPRSRLTRLVSKCRI